MTLPLARTSSPQPGALEQVPEAVGNDLRIRLVVEWVQDYAVFMLDPKGKVVTWNAGAERMKGYTAAEVIGCNYSCFYTQADIDQDVPQKILRLAREQGTAEVRQWRKRKNGTEFQAILVITAVTDPSGTLTGFFEISRDLTEQVDSDNRYRGLLEAAPDAMVVVNSGGHIVLLNLQAEKQFGYRRDELVGQRVTSIIPEGFAERLIADESRTDAEAYAQQIGTGIELVGQRKDGSEFPIEIMLSPLASAEGVLVTAAIRDISERRRAETKLTRVVEELRRSNDDLERFAYVASHDLQEPLRMVASYTQLLADRYKGRLDADADDFIGYAVDGANRMQQLIQDLLTYSRAGENLADPARISSEEALQAVLVNLSVAIAESGAVVSHDRLPEILMEERLLMQVLQNLIGNAVKYRSAEVPRIHVSCDSDHAEEWIFTVRDNGIGIDPLYFDTIFVLFKRLHGRDEFTGTGIGLSICKKILERTGGRIWVESAAQGGSAFRFAVPKGAGP